MKSIPDPTPTVAPPLRLWSLVFGLFLGLTLLKFGNPVILDRHIPTPLSWSEYLNQPWPVRWSFWGMGILLLSGLVLATRQAGTTWTPIHPMLRWPLLVWFGWQWISAGQSVDGTLTYLTLIHLTGVVSAFCLGVMILSQPDALRWALIGLVAALCFCLMRGVNQRLVEFPLDRAVLLEGQKTGWTNFPPEALAAMKQEGTLVTTNGVDVANPLILLRLERGRVHGTLVYPNALAGAVLLLLPVCFEWVNRLTQYQRSSIRIAALGLLGGLGFLGILWSGSKSGWLIALVMGFLLLLHRPMHRRIKTGMIVCLLVGGMVAFGMRFRGYFASGATSVEARMDYWKAAYQTALKHPFVGTGPGTFQRPYAQLKSPHAEMARLVHNDYLEQFSDSGWIGGIAYLTWVGSWLVLVGRWAWARADTLGFAVWIGVCSWFLQGFSEFALYVPALAWTAFALAGAAAGRLRTE